jgi:hypothetical protein
MHPVENQPTFRINTSISPPRKQYVPPERSPDFTEIDAFISPKMEFFTIAALGTLDPTFFLIIHFIFRPQFMKLNEILFPAVED